MMNPEGTAKPGLRAILHEGIDETLADRKGLLLYALPVASVVAVAWIVFDLLESDNTAIAVVVELVFAYMAFFWQRRYLMGADAAAPQGADKREEQRQLNRLAGRYVMRAAVFYVALFVLGLVIAFPLFLPFIEDDSANVVLVIGGVMVPVLAFLTIISARFLVAFPACAAGRLLGWADAWRLGRGYGLRMGVAICLLQIPVLLFVIVFTLAAPLDFQSGIAGTVAMNVGLAFLRVLTMFMALTCTAYVYRTITAEQDVPAFD